MIKNEQSRYDMSFKYFLDLAPTDDVIEPSTLTKFRKLRLKDENLLDLLISKTMQKIQLKKKPCIAERPDVKKKLNYLEETVNDTEERLYESADKDAKTGYKSSDDPFLGYKSHIAINSERLITAVKITSGEKSDSKELIELVEKSRLNGQKVEDVMVRSGLDLIYL